jgi:hypothetical protein
MKATAWLIWATEGEYSDRNEWPVAVSFDEIVAKRRTVRLGELWRHLVTIYESREEELDAALDWDGETLFDELPEGREFLAIGGAKDSLCGSYARDRLYTCCEVPVVSTEEPVA